MKHYYFVEINETVSGYENISKFVYASDNELTEADLHTLAKDERGSTYKDFDADSSGYWFDGIGIVKLPDITKISEEDYKILNKYL